MRGKEEESKAMGPMFPRLHVNDANKGGPRAPPRNKMALYEQLSVPSQRFNSSTSSSTRPQQKGGNLDPSNSSSQGGGNTERPFFSSFNVPMHTAAHSSDKVNLQSTDAPHQSPAGTDAERRPIKLVRREVLSSGKVNLQSTDAPHPSPAGTDAERRPIKLVRREVLSSGKVNLQSTDAPHPSPAGTDAERRPIKLVRREVLSSSKHSTAPDSSSTRANEASRRDSCSKKPVEDDDFMVPTLFKQKQATEKVLLGQESGDKSAKKFMTLPKFSSENSNINTNILEKGEGCLNSEREKGEGRERRDKEELEALHDGFMEETMLGISISPDDVVSAIGHKTFWKARRLIVNQQRVFAVQLFELHRLIKVQQLIAASPHVLLQSDSLLGKKLPAPIKPVLAIGSNLIARSQGSKYTDESQMIKDIPEYSSETVVVALENNTSNQEPVPSHEEAPDHNQVRSTATVNPVAFPMAPPENKPSNSSCLPPAPNQWLVPVMSPSEGLVYKPYSGPYAGHYPPAGSFISPFFPGCATQVPIPTATGDFLNSGYGVPMPMPVPVPSHPPQNMAAVGLPNYFPPFGMQVMNQNPGMIPNPVMSTSAVEQVSHIVASKNNGPVYVEQQSRSSCNMAELKSDAFSGCMWVRASKDSDLQGSTASSPFDRGDALPLFQMRSASTDAFLPKPSPSGGATTRVIKVVPHNPQLATQSAARIFQSIQKERKQN